MRPTIVLDTGATNHFIHPHHAINPAPTHHPIAVQLPDGSSIQTADAAELPITKLPQPSRIGHVLPSLASHSLVSIGRLCDHGFTATFTRDFADIIDNGRTVLRGQRTTDGLWTLPSDEALLTTSSTHADNIAFLHAACFSPSTKTLLQAVRRGNFASWPGFTAERISRLLTPSLATAMGHLDQQRQGLRSTTARTPDDTDSTPSPEPATQYLYAAIERVDHHGRTYSDQTGRFPVTGRNGAKYIMVLYDYDSNAILTAPLKNRTGAELLKQFQALFAQVQASGSQPRTHIMDNEASQALKQFLRSAQVDYQLVPPHIHRRNAAERAIRTFKNHFIAGLCSMDPNFPMDLWPHLLPQATITLNLLRQSRVHPSKSAYEHLFGTFDYNRTPLAPPGIRVLVHDKPSQRDSWAPHGTSGWYVGPAMEHYRCYTIFIPKTGALRVADTLQFFPLATKVPTTSPSDATLRAAQNLVDALRHHRITLPPNVGTDDNLALQRLSDIFDASQQRHEANSSRQVTPDVPKHDIICPEPPAERINTVVDPDTGEHMEYRQLISNPRTSALWQRSAANEFGRLAQGVGDRIQGTDTIHFIHKSELPSDRRPTYGRFVCTYRPQKSEKERTRLTVGGNLIDYPGATYAPTADLTTVKIVANDVVSTPGAKAVTGDLKNFYLGTPLPRPEYMRVHITDVPNEIIDQYDLRSKADDRGWVYIRIDKGMYGLPQAGRLANDQLAKLLELHGYYQARHTPGLWRHNSRPIKFALVVDDFFISYVDKQHADHLLEILAANYEGLTVDWTASHFCGITFEWDYCARTVDLSMPGYIDAALHKFGYAPSKRPQHAPHRYVTPTYGKDQTPEQLDTSPALDSTEHRRIQQIVGTLLYYARAVDSSLLVALSALASAQAKPTEQTRADLHRLLDYCATHPDAKVRFCKSDMLLKIHSDAGYTNAARARSRVGGHFYLGNQHQDPSNQGAFLNTTSIMRHVAASASEAELAALFANMKDGAMYRQVLLDLGYPQPTTPMFTDNTTAAGIANDAIKQLRTRALDMRLHWVRDQVEQQHFSVHWLPAADNLADLFTKHHSPKTLLELRPKYFVPSPQVALMASLQAMVHALRGCVEPGREPGGSSTRPSPKSVANRAGRAVTITRKPH